MAIQMRNKRDTNFSMASMSDLVFLLLIFFMLTSTLVAPNAIKLLLPSSSSKTMSKQTVTVYINKERNIFVEDQKVDPAKLENVLINKLGNEQEGSIVLRSDKTAPVQDIVVVIDAVNEINRKNGTKHKVILATKPKR
ncbi:MAG: biopolymer transporter ExbD [Bacteroidetes bacterium]|nr:MAG: biopolymer transporter ExbD [Bacteroidota bacterium]RLD49405.1 MAG: biopolymer transporter ExbD [Bacteroidota bacterium]RLD74306.1 MAG: biopolymer transporter ExbD [Bacteroidota bacterium]RLD87616.1 MAG: biopolymer transporter ExbD [Bacteroidota bacterium]